MTVPDRTYARRWLTLGVLCLSLVLIGLDNTVLNVALPTIQRTFDASAADLQWMVDAYVLVFAGLLLTMGALGDRFGRARALQVGLPWMQALRTDLADGYLARLDNGRITIVADGFHFTNEIRFDAKEEYLYVVETTGGCITRLRIDERGNVTGREIFGPTSLGRGAWPDGIAFDSAGNLWGTLVYSDKLFVITPEGDLRVLLDEGDPDKVCALEQAFLTNSVTEEVLFATGRGLAPWMASVTFGGPDLRTVYIGSLKGSRIPFFRAPVPGLPMVHWNDKPSVRI